MHTLLIRSRTLCIRYPYARIRYAYVTYTLTYVMHTLPIRSHTLCIRYSYARIRYAYVTHTQPRQTVVDSSGLTLKSCAYKWFFSEIVIRYSYVLSYAVVWLHLYLKRFVQSVNCMIYFHALNAWKQNPHILMQRIALKYHNINCPVNALSNWPDNWLLLHSMNAFSSFCLLFWSIFCFLLWRLNICKT